MNSLSSRKKGFAPTPILMLFRFFKIISHGVSTLIQAVILVKNDGETKKQHQQWYFSKKDGGT